ncbi:MAG: putative DNA primase large subunit [Methanomicrobiales archaeon 53_19]|jgi:DNA primase large subunit|uniref:DNA primase large subunit PriL n=1 Tax=Methanocalculus sp. TaxID=2004547 RepID=UPI000747CDB2|nr:DNA primase large subunit PriL [Methanocalculus sp.]KUK69828.1 MAG: putative DNA primase large subunit [Methanocalculus sp. 52_23]KUL04299.1 MAG: putative DNA primase large subunit [Methanomicrobiales archaeon 53_19]HIJ06054.1 DNA primase large subunit PriL [Methanocalculus sp.]
MKIRLELQDIAHYPFLKEAQEVIAARGFSLATITGNSKNKEYLDAAVERIRDAAQSKKGRVWTDSDDPFLDILSYGLARILISCIKNRSGIATLARYEAERAFYFLQIIETNDDIRQHIFRELDIPFSGSSISYIRFIELTQTLREDSFRLVNRDLSKGQVSLNDEEKYLLLRERIRTLLLEQLPLDLPDSVCEHFSEHIMDVQTIIAERTVEEYGDVDESRFPPCIHALYEAAIAGKYLTHSGRFALTTFLHTIGMDATEIISTFSQGSDFNIEITSYQVNHIISQGTDGYTSPSCATMMTHGICSGKNAKCKQVTHPLSYYRKEKKANKKTVNMTSK